MHVRLTPRVAAVGLTAALTLAACGGDDTAAPDSTTTTTGAANPTPGQGPLGGSSAPNRPGQAGGPAQPGGPGQGPNRPGGNGPVWQTDDEGATRLDGTVLRQQLDALPTGTLSDADRDGARYMVEEEKLAHDVYVALGERWDLPVFDNIAAAELTDTDAVRAVLARHDLTDPSEGRAEGEFADPALRSLYDDLVERGSASLVAALEVGALIEELDIADLRSRASDQPDLQLVYDHLERGSRNHLRAFVRQLERNGATYSPTHLSADDFEAIVTSDIERGN